MTATTDETRMRADARRSRAKLLEAATAAFAENGADAPLDDIARRAGVGIGTLYRHFPTRLDLQAAVYRSQVQSVCATADDLIVNATPEQAFAGWLRAMTAYLATTRGLAKALIDAVGKDSELISGCWVAMHDTAERLLKHAQETGVLRRDVTSQDVLRLVHGIVLATEQSPQDTDRLLAVMFDDLRARPAAGDASLDAGGTVFVRRAEDDRGARGHVRERPDLLEQVLECRRRRHPDLEDVILVTSNAVTCLDSRESGQPLRHVVGRGRVKWLYRHEGGERKPDHLGIAQRHVPGDDALGLQPAHALVHRGH